MLVVFEQKLTYPLKVYYRAAFDNIVNPVPILNVDETGCPVSSNRVRQHFPETWLWLHEMTQY